jgi:uncharacterized protein
MPFDPQVRTPYAREQVLVRGATSDAERTFMAAVYRWMTAGLAVTTLVALYVASSEPLLQAIYGNRFVLIGLMVVELGLVVALSAAAQRLSAGAAGGMFLLYSALNGATLAGILLVYTGASVGLAFASTAGTFGVMSVYGTVTKKDLTSWGSFLFMGLVGIIIASVVNMFVGSSMVTFVVSCMGVLVFTGLTAYDTQKLRAFARAGGGTGTLAVNGALSLYLDFVNLFLSLLRLFGNRR